MKNNTLILLSIVMISCMTLSACGGGGGGEGGVVVIEPILPTLPNDVTPPPVVATTASFETAEYNQNYALDAMNASSAYARGATGDGILVAVIDSGVRTKNGFFTSLFFVFIFVFPDLF